MKLRVRKEKKNTSIKCNLRVKKRGVDISQVVLYIDESGNP